MAWTDMEPEATDVLLECRVVSAKGKEVSICIDRLPEGGGSTSQWFRVTAGNLFGSERVALDPSLHGALRSLNAVLERN